jgi:hypothetical protein
MTPAHIVLVRNSSPRSRHPDTTATLVYARLFAREPSLGLLFRSYLHAQGRTLMTVLRDAVDGLSCQDTLVRTVEERARRHIGDGVSDKHDATVRAAVLQ